MATPARRVGSSHAGRRPPQPVVARRGDEDVRVVLVSTGSITASFAHAPGAEARLQCTLQTAAGGEPHHAFAFPAETASGTGYRFAGLPLGTYRLVATLPGESTPCVTIDGIDVHAGDNHDPRLDGIVLSDVATLRIELRDERGDLLAFDGLHESFVCVRDEGGDDWLGSIFMAARTFLLVRPGPTDVVIVVPGYRPVRRSGVQGTVVAQLEPLPTVPVLLVVEGKRPDDRLRVELEPLEAGTERYRFRLYGKTTIDSPTPWLRPALFRGGETEDVAVDGPGRYRLRVFCPQLPGSDKELTDVEPQTFVVPADGTTPPIEVHARLPR